MTRNNMRASAKTMGSALRAVIQVFGGEIRGSWANQGHRWIGVLVEFGVVVGGLV